MKVNLFCFPFAGGSKYSYNNYVRSAPHNIRVIPLEYPGRGARFKETLLTDVNEIVEDCFRNIKDYTSERYAIYGHSMGSVVAYLLTKKIIAHGLPQPLHLFVTGRGGPSYRDNEILPPRYLMSKDKFIEALKVLGGSPDEVLNDEGLMNFFEPIFRADFQALETYVYQDSESFSIPITVMTGSEELLTRDQVFSWQKETTLPINIKQFIGNHFFIFRYTDEIMKIVSQSISRVVAAPVFGV